nr:hypothetical protein Iba_scaffold3049CG1140 [Ipomoea batatas]
MINMVVWCLCAYFQLLMTRNFYQRSLSVSLREF